MTMHVERRLSGLEEEIAALGVGLDLLYQHLEDRRSAAFDLWARSLAAETPYADRDFRIADEEVRRVARSVHEEEVRLATLEAERDRLLGELTAGQARPPNPPRSRGS